MAEGGAAAGIEKRRLFKCADCRFHRIERRDAGDKRLELCIYDGGQGFAKCCLCLRVRRVGAHIAGSTVNKEPELVMIIHG